MRQGTEGRSAVGRICTATHAQRASLSYRVRSAARHACAAPCKQCVLTVWPKCGRREEAIRHTCERCDAVRVIVALLYSSRPEMRWDAVCVRVGRQCAKATCRSRVSVSRFALRFRPARKPPRRMGQVEITNDNNGLKGHCFDTD